MNVFNTVGKYLKGIDNIRFEWSLKITPNSIAPRSSILFWITNYDRQDRSFAFSKLHCLLNDLSCPEEIIFNAIMLAPSSKAQGLLVPLDGTLAAKKRVYIEHWNGCEGQTTRTGLEWNQETGIKGISYQFKNFINSDCLVDVNTNIHPDLHGLLIRLIDEQLLNKMGYYHQVASQKVSETYVTYPWQPEFNTISNILEGYFPAIAGSKLRIYNEFCFRHIGFSNSAAFPAVTIYFSAGLKGLWPSDFESFQRAAKGISLLNLLQ